MFNNRYIRITGSTLYLTEEAVQLLGVSIGDRLCVRFNGNPIVATPAAVGEPNGGNLLTKRLGVSCRGATSKAVKAFGEQFEYELESEGYLVLTKAPDELKAEIRRESKDGTIELADSKEIDFEFVLKDK